MSSTPLLEGRVSGQINEIIEFDVELGYSMANSINDERSESRLADIKTTSPDVCVAGVKNTESANGISDKSSESRLADVKTTSPEVCLDGAKNAESANGISDSSSESRLADVRTTSPEVSLADVNNAESEASTSEPENGSRTFAKNAKSEASNAEKESWGKRLRTAVSSLCATVSSPEPRLPVCTSKEEEQEKLTDKRQALFGVALAVLVALLTSAAGLQVFPSTFTPWIAGISAVLWIAVSCGLVMDLFGKTKLEFLLASCLSRLGVMGVTVLFCLFIFGAFFPSATTTMWVLVAFAVALHASLCVVSRVRGDEQTSTSNCQANKETASKCSGCTCRCRLDV